ncbi:MAG: AAA family ATPase [Actinomycetota bacterium]|nr:AAA family ATPase [Actinomycetota bacterium]
MTDELSVRDREIAKEQRHVDRAYDELRRRRLAAAATRAESYAVASVGNYGALVERDALVHNAARRLRELDAQHEGLVFGRLDLVGDVVRYVGRIGLLDAAFEPLVVDWRAPAAAPFYQATAAEPGEVRRRRVIRTSGQRVVDVEDDLLASVASAEDLPVVGEGALMAALGQATGTGMRDIVATIQREQDLAIRAPATGVTTIGGGPGTGKTAVATHRAAYLLYRDRRRFEAGGVLIVGPSPVFIAYIERVLPSLGESSVSLRALGEVVDGVSASAVDPPAVAAVKGSLRMARFLERAVRYVPPGAPDSLRVTYMGEVLSLGPVELASARRAVGRRRRPVNRAVGLASDALVEGLWRRRPPGAQWERARFAEEIVERPAFEEFLAGWWPVLSPAAVLGWCASRTRASRYAEGLLSPSEVDLLVSSWRGSGVSVADVALLDELRVLLGRPVARPVAAPDPEEDTMPELTTVADRELAARAPVVRGDDYDGYAHIVVDESQDVSPMQWRMLGRRGRYASWTVVGDPAQSAWEDAEEALLARSDAVGRKAVHEYELTTNYRNPVEIFSLAASVLRRVDASASLPDAVRSVGVAPSHLLVTDLAHAVRTAALDLLASVEGTVGVICPGGWLDEVLGRLGPSPDGRLQVVEALGSKGMEYDGVLAVEPDAIADGTEAGVRTLYVVLSRATQRLVTVGTTQDWLVGLS